MTTWTDRCLEMAAFAPEGTSPVGQLGDPLNRMPLNHMPSGHMPSGQATGAHEAGGVESALAQIDGKEPVALAFDGSLEGLLASVYVAFAARCSIEDVCEGRLMQLRLGQRVVVVPTDVEAAQRVQRSICRSLGRECWRAVAAAGSSGDPRRGSIVLAFLRYALSPERTGACNACPRKPACAKPCERIPRNRLLDEWANPHVEPLLALQRMVASEAEKMRQFMRFERTEDDVWVARCNPKCSVVPFVMNHFARRFNTQSFIVYDETHQLAGVSREGRWQLVRTDYVPSPTQASDEAEMQEAWKRFYHALSIDERYHPELQRQFMPMRLRKHLTELQPI